MNKDEEREILLEKVGWLKFLLDYHVQHRDNSSMSDKEFEEYTDAVLDEILDIQNRLTELEKGEL